MDRLPPQDNGLPRWSVLILTLFVVGCAHVKPEPFDEFSQSVKQLRKGADDALSINNDQNRTRYIDDTAQASLTVDGADAVQNLMLDKSSAGDPFGWSWPSGSPPLFMESQRFRSGVYVLNSALVSYAGLLANLAAENLIPQQEFDTLAKDLNANLSSATSALGKNPADQSLGIISTAASGAFHEYLEHQRRAALQKAIEENQANIQTIADLMQEALRITAANLRQNYDQESLRSARQLTPDAGGNLTSRKSKVKTFIALNEEYIARLAVLRALDQSYRTLPQAHRELVAATKDSKISIASIRQLYDNGKHLHELYKGLSKEGAGSN